MIILQIEHKCSFARRNTRSEPKLANPARKAAVVSAGKRRLKDPDSPVSRKLRFKLLSEFHCANKLAPVKCTMDRRPDGRFGENVGLVWASGQAAKSSKIYSSCRSRWCIRDSHWDKCLMSILLGEYYSLNTTHWIVLNSILQEYLTISRTTNRIQHGESEKEDSGRLLAKLLVSCEQFGFRPFHSTFPCLASLVIYFFPSKILAKPFSPLMSSYFFFYVQNSSGFFVLRFRLAQAGSGVYRVDTISLT